MEECEDCADVAEEYTLPAIALSLVIATGIYGAITTVMRGGFRPVETVLFGVFFSVFYVLYLRYVGKGLGSLLPVGR